MTIDDVKLEGEVKMAVFCRTINAFTKRFPRIRIFETDEGGQKAVSKVKKIKIKKTQSHHHCLFAICMYPSLKCLFMTLLHFPIGLFICLFKVRI